MYTTFIGLKTQEQKEVLEKICQDIHKKDSTFKFEIKPPKKPNSQYIFLLMIQSPDKNTAHKRGCWLVNKAILTPSPDMLPASVTSSGKIATKTGLLYWVK
jgi:hypothetical protein